MIFWRNVNLVFPRAFRGFVELLRCGIVHLRSTIRVTASWRLAQFSTRLSVSFHELCAILSFLFFVFFFCRLHYILHPETSENLHKKHKVLRTKGNTSPASCLRSIEGQNGVRWKKRDEDFCRCWTELRDFDWTVLRGAPIQRTGTDIGNLDGIESNANVEYPSVYQGRKEKPRSFPWIKI